MTTPFQKDILRAARYANAEQALPATLRFNVGWLVGLSWAAIIATFVVVGVTGAIKGFQQYASFFTPILVVAALAFFYAFGVGLALLTKRHDVVLAIRQYTTNKKGDLIKRITTSLENDPTMENDSVYIDNRSNLDLPQPSVDVMLEINKKSKAYIDAPTDDAKRQEYLKAVKENADKRLFTFYVDYLVNAIKTTVPTNRHLFNALKYVTGLSDAEMGTAGISAPPPAGAPAGAPARGAAAAPAPPTNADNVTIVGTAQDVIDRIMNTKKTNSSIT